MLSITGVILAGGRAERMGGVDKGLVEYQKRPMIEYVIDSMEGAEALIINANRSHQRYEQYGLELLKDERHPEIGLDAGPLLGILSGLNQARTPWVLFSPCDTPNLPKAYLRRMAQTAQDHLAKAVVAYDGERSQPLHLLVNKCYQEGLLMYLLSGQRKTYDWLQQLQPVKADFSDCPDAFMNINRAEDLA